MCVGLCLCVCVCVPACACSCALCRPRVSSRAFMCVWGAGVSMRACLCMHGVCEGSVCFSNQYFINSHRGMLFGVSGLLCLLLLYYYYGILIRRVKCKIIIVKS